MPKNMDVKQKTRKIKKAAQYASKLIGSLKDMANMR
jgi:hypothetical protein